MNIFLSALKENIEHKNQNRKEILALAGAWSDMSENNSKEYLQAAQATFK